MRTRVKRIITWSSLLIAAPLIILFLHIYIVTRSSEKPGISWHLTRIEFQQVPLDSLTAANAKKTIDQIPEVLDSYLNMEKGTLVYATAAGSFQSQEVFNKFIRRGPFEATKYIPEQGKHPARSCPVLSKQSVTYQIGSFFHNLFKKDNIK